MKTCRQINYAGRVQGVGFRYSVKQIAVSYTVTGWVRNLPDGTVELRVCGEAEEVEAFLVEVTDGQLARFIKEANEQDVPGDETMPTGFEIRH